MNDFNERKTYLIVDGENIDATLGMSVLGRRPNPDERPRWDRVAEFAAELWEQPATNLFFLNASSGQMPLNFVQALLAMDYRPVPLAGDATEKVVDIGIQRTLDVLVGRPADVLLASHDGDFLPQLDALLDRGHRVGVIAFREFVSSQLAALSERGVTVYDLEHVVGAFTTQLPRVRIIPLDEFDPTMFI
nr:NYN domain-containing protein [Rarobacter incanus]